MNLDELRQQNIRQTLGIEIEKFGRILTFVDFANVNHWFDNEDYGLDGVPLREDQSVQIDIDKLKSFTNTFSTDTRFYYGHNPPSAGSMAFH